MTARTTNLMKSNKNLFIILHLLRQLMLLLLTLLLHKRSHSTNSNNFRNKDSTKMNNYSDLITTLLHELINGFRAKNYPHLFLFCIFLMCMWFQSMRNAKSFSRMCPLILSNLICLNSGLNELFPIYMLSLFYNEYAGKKSDALRIPFLIHSVPFL